MNNLNTQILALLNSALAEKLPLDEITKFVSELPSDVPAKFDEACHQLMHFASDADIRARDPAYAEFTREQLRKYVHYFQT